MQHRGKLVLEFWDRKKVLTIENEHYKNFVKDFFSFLLKYDIKNCDATTNSLINANKNISAAIMAKEDGILAGIEEFKFLNKDLKINSFKNDGDKIKKNELLIKISGNARKILERERTSLNLLQRMSGIATLTYKLNKKLKNNAKIAATRKTLWGVIDKKAVSIGNGLTHRLNLSDGIIIKDNHLKILNYDIQKALKSADGRSKYIEIEAENKKQALIAANAVKKLIGENKLKKNSLFAIMLDKIQPKEINSIIKNLKNQDLYGYALLEASGNINSDNLLEYANCDVDIISMGYLTNPGKSLNMSMEITK